jgi:hypothetical protein
VAPETVTDRRNLGRGSRIPFSSAKKRVLAVFHVTRRMRCPGAMGRPDAEAHHQLTNQKIMREITLAVGR